MIEKQESRKIDLWLSIFLIAVVVLFSGVTYITGDLSTYMATPIAIANDGIFSNDFSIMEFVRPNAQSISDNFIALFLRIGIPWQVVSIVGYLITVAIFGAGIIAISKRLSSQKYYIIAGVLMFFSIYALSGLRIGRNPIWYPSFYYAQLGFCIAVWGFVKALDKKWYYAFILFAIATLFHFTVGSYCAAFVLIFLIIEALKNKEYKLLLAPIIWIVSCVSIFALMYFSGTTGSGLLSNDAFVKIHAYLRHPHHHVPSTWEKIAWVNFICYISAVFIVLRYSLSGNLLYKKLKSFFLISTILMAGLLVIDFIFVEIIPIAFIAKLQPARSVGIYRFFLAILLAYSIFELIKKKEYYPSVFIIFMTALPQIDARSYSGILLLIVAFYLLFNQLAKNKKITSLKVISHIAVLVLILMVVAYCATNIAILVKILYNLAFIVLLSAVVMVDEFRNKKGEAIFTKAVALVVAFAMIIIPWIDVEGNFSQVKFKSVKKAITLVDVDFAAETLAERFGEKTDQDAIFLGDPYDITTSYFRMFSLRSTVVAFKNMPFTDEGMLEWVDRLSELHAISTDENGYYIKHTKSFSELTPSEMIELANKYNAEYILVNFDDEKLQEIYNAGANEFDIQGKWTVVKIG